MGIHKNATAIFANFEKRHCSVQTLKNATPDFKKCRGELADKATYLTNHNKLG